MEFKSSYIHRLLAEKQIRLSRIRINRWLAMVRELTEKDLEVENEVCIRPGTKGDLDFLLTSEDTMDPGRHILDQDTKFWDQYGFRCLYTGYLQNEGTPLCVNYAIDHSDKHRFEHMEYGNLYGSLQPDTVYMEGGYIRKDMRGEDYFRKFQLKLNGKLYNHGKRFIRGHIVVKSAKEPAFLWANAVGFIPDHFVSRVTIKFFFLKSDVFVCHAIRPCDFEKYPLPIFQSSSFSS